VNGSLAIATIRHVGLQRSFSQSDSRVGRSARPQSPWGRPGPPARSLDFPSTLTAADALARPRASAAGETVRLPLLLVVPLLFGEELGGVGGGREESSAICPNFPFGATATATRPAAPPSLIARAKVGQERHVRPKCAYSANVKGGLCVDKVLFSTSTLSWLAKMLQSAREKKEELLLPPFFAAETSILASFSFSFDVSNPRGRSRTAKVRSI